MILHLLTCHSKIRSNMYQMDANALRTKFSLDLNAGIQKCVPTGTRRVANKNWIKKTVANDEEKICYFKKQPRKTYSRHRQEY